MVAAGIAIDRVNVSALSSLLWRPSTAMLANSNPITVFGFVELS